MLFCDGYWGFPEFKLITKNRHIVGGIRTFLTGLYNYVNIWHGFDSLKRRGPMELCQASKVMVGDVIDGPDGRSTVISVRNIPGIDMLQFDFAEGRGNRCWSGLRPTEKVTRLEKTFFDMPLGFVVGRNNEVKISGVFEVVDKGKNLQVNHFLSTVITRTTLVPKKDVNRIMGEFTYTLKPAR